MIYLLPFDKTQTRIYFHFIMSINIMIIKTNAGYLQNIKNSFHLKVKILLLSLLLTGLFCKAQNFQLKIIGSDKSESKIIDSIGYNTKMQN